MIETNSNLNQITLIEMKTDELKQEKGLGTPEVSNRYLFWFEDEGKEGWTFEIETNDSAEAFKKAYDTHGPQVEGMMYQLL